MDAPGAASDDVPVSSLPRPLALAIFEQLPLDTRLRCVEVCRAWRQLFSDPSLWTKVHFRGLRPEQRNTPLTVELLWVAVTRSRGALTALDLEWCAAESMVVVAAVAASGATLRELDLNWGAASSEQHCPHFLRLLLRCAPALQELYTDVGSVAVVDSWLPVAQALPLLRGEPPWAPLHLRSLCVLVPGDDVDDAVRALAAALRHPCDVYVRALHVYSYGVQGFEAAAFEDLADAIVFAGTRELQLTNCGLGPAAAPALVRLLSDSWVQELKLGASRQVLDQGSVAPVAEALRANDYITSFALRVTGMWADPAVGTALCRALVGHPSLETLELYDNAPPAEGGEALIGPLYAELVAANAPALTTLDLSGSSLGVEVFRPLLQALCSNTHLWHLNMTAGGTRPLRAYFMSERFAAFVQDELIPAVEANMSLRHLDYTPLDSPAKAHIEALLAARRAADEARERAAEEQQPGMWTPSALSAAAELGVQATVGEP